MKPQDYQVYFLIIWNGLKLDIIGFIFFSQTLKNFEFFHFNDKPSQYYLLSYNFKAFFDGVIYNF